MKKLDIMLSSLDVILQGCYTSNMRFNQPNWKLEKKNNLTGSSKKKKFQKMKGDNAEKKIRQIFGSMIINVFLPFTV